MSNPVINYKEQIQYLTELQKIDEEHHHLMEQRGNLPFLIDQLDKEIAGIEEKKAIITQRTEDHNKAIEIQKKRATEAENKAKQYDKEKDKTKSKQELDLIMEDIELQKIEVLLSEKKIKEHHHTIEIEENKIKSLKKEMKEKKLVLTDKKSLLNKIDEESKKKKETLKKRRDNVKKHLLIDIYDLYEKISSRHKNAVINISNQICTGCNLMLTLQKIVDVATYEKIHTCPYCSRILAYVESVTSVPKKKLRRRTPKATSNEEKASEAKA